MSQGLDIVVFSIREYLLASIMSHDHEFMMYFIVFNHPHVVEDIGSYIEPVLHIC